MRRSLLLAVVVGSQLAAGCYCYRPYLPRLQSGFGCSAGTCGGSLFGGGPGVLGGPGLRGIVAPVTAGIPVGTPLAYAGGDPITHGGGYPVSGGHPTGDYATPGCTGCGAGGVSAGYPGGPSGSGMPLSTVPHGYPGGSAGVPYSPVPQGYYSGSGFPAGSAPMPMVMPSAMPGGVPHDSALLKMPTIVPPGPPTISKRPEELARQLPAGK